jgi:hypothetical protein
MAPVIRVRRVRGRWPFGRVYEVEYTPKADPTHGWHRVTRSPNSDLEPILGVGDAWSFVNEADRVWSDGERGWAVEFDERP